MTHIISLYKEFEGILYALAIDDEQQKERETFEKRKNRSV